MHSRQTHRSFQFDSGDFAPGFGIFTRENNTNDRSRFNALRITSVPEPGRAALLAFGALGLIARRRR
ncbi:MAG: PEP-CTERM sorting domain-containing protein [Verrucomicrobiales bacterium]